MPDMDYGLLEGIGTALNSGFDSFIKERERSRKSKESKLSNLLTARTKGYLPVYGENGEITDYQEDPVVAQARQQKAQMEQKKLDAEMAKIESQRAYYEYLKNKPPSTKTSKDYAEEAKLHAMDNASRERIAQIQARSRFRPFEEESQLRGIGKLSPEQQVENLQTKEEGANYRARLHQQGSIFGKLTPEQQMQQKEFDRNSQERRADISAGASKFGKLSPDQQIAEKEKERQSRYDVGTFGKLTADQTLQDKDAERMSRMSQAQFGKLSADQQIAQKEADRQSLEKRADISADASMYGKLSADQLMSQKQKELASLEKRAAMSKNPQDRAAIDKMKVQAQKELEQMRQSGAKERAEIAAKNRLEIERNKPYSKENRLPVEQERSKNRLEVERLRQNEMTKRAGMYGNPNEYRQETAEDQLDATMKRNAFSKDPKTGEWVFDENLYKKLHPAKVGSSPGKSKNPLDDAIKKERYDQLKKKGDREDKYPELKGNQADAARWGRDAEKALEIMRDLRKKGYRREEQREGMKAFGANLPIVGSAVESYMGPETKAWLAAERQFINARLRSDTGATITKSEDELAKKFMIQAGDRTENINQKFAAMEDEIGAWKAEAGLAWDTSSKRTTHAPPIPLKLPAAKKPKFGTKAEYSKSRNQTRFLDASGKVIKVLDGDQR